jgi:hypothetical protein
MRLIPRGDFASEPEAVFAGGFSDQVVGHLLEGGEIGGSMVGADTAFVVAKDHIHHPVEAVFDRPMAANDWPQLVRQQHQ